MLSQKYFLAKKQSLLIPLRWPLTHGKRSLHGSWELWYWYCRLSIS